jgi:RimJ/RimL family protein N-acetyltransferase
MDRGVTAAVTLREVVTERSLFARAAEDDLASRRVLEKCGFVVVGQDRANADARGGEIVEVRLRLN